MLQFVISTVEQNPVKIDKSLTNITNFPVQSFSKVILSTLLLTDKLSVKRLDSGNLHPVAVSLVPGEHGFQVRPHTQHRAGQQVDGPSPQANVTVLPCQPLSTLALPGRSVWLVVKCVCVCEYEFVCVCVCMSKRERERERGRERESVCA